MKKRNSFVSFVVVAVVVMLVAWLAVIELSYNAQDNASQETRSSAFISPDIAPEDVTDDSSSADIAPATELSNSIQVRVEEMQNAIASMVVDTVSSDEPVVSSDHSSDSETPELKQFKNQVERVQELISSLDTKVEQTHVKVQSTHEKIMQTRHKVVENNFDQKAIVRAFAPLHITVKNIHDNIATLRSRVSYMNMRVTLLQNRMKLMEKSGISVGTFQEQVEFMSNHVEELKDKINKINIELTDI